MSTARSSRAPPTEVVCSLGAAEAALLHPRIANDTVSGTRTTHHRVRRQKRPKSPRRAFTLALECSETRRFLALSAFVVADWAYSSSHTFSPAPRPKPFHVGDLAESVSSDTPFASTTSRHHALTHFSRRPKSAEGYRRTDRSPKARIPIGSVSISRDPKVSKPRDP